MAASSPDKPACNTLPLPTELICQILCELTLYDRRSFGLCSSDCYKIASKYLFDSIIVGSTLGTSVIADELLRGGPSRLQKKRTWRRPLSSRSLIMLSGARDMFGDLRFLREHHTIVQQVRSLHVGLPATPAWKTHDPKGPRFGKSNNYIGPMQLSQCLVNLPNLTSLSLYYSPPLLELRISNTSYQGLDLRLFYFIISRFATNRKLDKFEINWWPKLDQSFFGRDGYFNLPNGARIFPLRAPGSQEDGQDGATDNGSTEILLCGPPSASCIKLNLLTGSYPIREIPRDEYRPVYTPPYANKRPQGGRAKLDSKTFELLLPRMIYSILLPSVFARTLTDLELRLDTCVCCCSYNAMDMPHLPLAIRSLSTTATQPGTDPNNASNLDVQQHQTRKFDRKYLAVTPLKKFAYHGVRCTGVLPSIMNAPPRNTTYAPKISWLNYAAEMWWESLKELTVMESTYPHAGSDRGEKYGRGPAEWVRNIHMAGLIQLKNLEVLRVGYKFSGDERDEGLVTMAWKIYDSSGIERSGEEYAELKREFERNDTNAVVKAVSNAVQNLKKTREQDAESESGPDVGNGTATSVNQWINMEGHNYHDKDVKPPTLLLTPLEAARQAYYRGGRRRRTKEIQKFALHMPALKMVEWVMHGVHTLFVDFNAERLDEDDWVLPEKREVELAQTVCFNFRIQRLSGANGGVDVRFNGFEGGQNEGWGAPG